MLWMRRGSGKVEKINNFPVGLPGCESLVVLCCIDEGANCP